MAAPNAPAPAPADDAAEAPEKKEKKEKPKISAEEQNKRDLERSKKEIESLEQGLKKATDRLAAGKAIENDPKERQKIYEEEHKPQYERARQEIQQLLAPADAKFKAAQEQLAAFMKTVPPNTPKTALDAHPQYQTLKRQLDECKENRDKVASALVDVNARETEEKRGLRGPPKSNAEGHSRDIQDAMEDMKNAKNPMEAIAHLLRAFTALMALMKGEVHSGVQQGKEAQAAQGRRNALKTEVAGTTAAAGKTKLDTLITNKQTALDAPTGPKKSMANLEEAKTKLDANTARRQALEALPAGPPSPPGRNAAQEAELTAVKQAIELASGYDAKKADLQKVIDKAETEIKDLTAMKEETKAAVNAENVAFDRMRTANPKLSYLEGIRASVGSDGISLTFKVDTPVRALALRNTLGSPPPLPVAVLGNDGTVSDPTAFKDALQAKMGQTFDALKATNTFQRAVLGLKNGEWHQTTEPALTGFPAGFTKAMNMRGNILLENGAGELYIMPVGGDPGRLAKIKGGINDAGSQRFYDAVLKGGGEKAGNFIAAPAGVALAAPDAPPATPPIATYSVELTTFTLSCATADKKNVYKYNPSGAAGARWSRVLA
ncbi:MAG: hypothetical protein PHH13_03540 [Candidatus Peribacteraceae bacterium]|nr:hypothetical protein [Candidatus Peribacteraceae bacterium]